MCYILPSWDRSWGKDHDLPSNSLVFMNQNQVDRASLVAQWLRIQLPMQGTWVRVLVQEDTTCRGATKPVRHNYWACALEPVSHNYWARMPQLLKPTRLEPVLRNKRSHRNEKPVHRNQEQSPLATTRESPRAATKTQCSQKKKKRIKGTAFSPSYSLYLESSSFGKDLLPI